MEISKIVLLLETIVPLDCVNTVLSFVEFDEYDRGYKIYFTASAEIYIRWDGKTVVTITELIRRRETVIRVIRERGGLCPKLSCEYVSLLIILVILLIGAILIPLYIG